MLPRKWFYTLMYWRKPRWDTGVSPPELMDFIASHPPGRGLDLGCGTGTNAITLAQHGWTMTGIDFVRKAIATARRKARQAGLAIDFRLGDVTKLDDLRAPFDLILDIGCYHSLLPAQRQAYGHNLSRLLRPGGIFLLYGFLKNPELPSANGVSDEDFAMFSQSLKFLTRSDGLDGSRSSTWWTFEKPADE